VGIQDACASQEEPAPVGTLLEIETRLRDFRRDREWEQYHTPKNLAISVAIEAGELLEHFQWRSDADVAEYLRTNRDVVGEELADVAIYVIQLAEVAGVALMEAIETKIADNAARYPVEIARGNHQKQPACRPAALEGERIAESAPFQKRLASKIFGIRRAG
jgi:dCTP diphosphatase